MNVVRCASRAKSSASRSGQSLYAELNRFAGKVVEVEGAAVEGEGMAPAMVEEVAAEGPVGMAGVPGVCDEEVRESRGADSASRRWEGWL